MLSLLLQQHLAKPVQAPALIALLVKKAAHALLIRIGRWLKRVLVPQLLSQALAKLALLALMHLLDPLPLLLAFARPTTSELETEVHAPFALVVEPLLSKRQSQLLPLRTLTVLARQTSMEMVPHALLALVALMHLLDPLPLLLAFARPISSELETEVHALLVITVAFLLSKQ
jgi:hypothetical protein